MESISVNCPAKINLSLDILGKRSDGYHEISTIMQTVSLEDKIVIRKSDKFSLESTKKNLPTDDTNIALKVAKLMFREFNIKGGLSIYIEKNIPIAAGLAGGSSNAAGVILGINELYDIKASKVDLRSIANLVGSDVSFLLDKGTALCTSRGENVRNLRNLKGYYVLIARPNIDISTKWVYENLDIKNIGERPNNNLLVKAIENDDINTISNNLVNVLERVTISKYEVIDSIKKKMINDGALGAIMSGSGASVFGIFNKDKIKTCYNDLRKEFSDVYITKMI